MTEPLQFDSAEPAGTATALTCANCGAAISESYHMLNQTVLCERCRTALEAAVTTPPDAAEFTRALVFGLGGAALGAAIYYAVLVITNLNIGLIAIAVGWLVGRGVQKGSGNRGGVRYQLLAVALTYAAVAATYLPPALEYLRTEGLEVPVGTLVMFALQAPVTIGVQSIISLLITGFALYQAFIMNRKPALVFSGPYKVGAQPPA
jgi:hypothetical protein